MNCRISNLPVQPLIGKSGRLYICMVVPSVVCHTGDISDFTLAFEDAQVIPPFFREETENTDDTDDTGEKMIQMLQEVQKVQKVQNVQNVQNVQKVQKVQHTFGILFGYFRDIFWILMGYFWVLLGYFLVLFRYFWALFEACWNFWLSLLLFGFLGTFWHF